MFFCSLSPPRKLRVIAIIMAVLSVLTGLATSTFQIFQCWPVSYFWTRFESSVKGTCVAQDKAFAILQTVNSFDILTDSVLALLPAIMLWNMNMKRLEKMGVSILLGLGIL